MKKISFVLVVGILCVTLVTTGSARANVKSKADAYIPDVLILLDDSDHKPYAVVVEKSSQQVFLFSYNGTFEEVMKMKCSTGEEIGPKKRSGDRKTPEGVYFFINRYHKRYLTPIYGTKAFPIDYPNLLDRIAGHDGNSIWMHGTNKPIRPRDSNGCVALANNDIDKLSDYITLKKTPIVIVDHLKYVTESYVKQQKEDLTKFLSAWKNSLETGAYHDYLGFYDNHYLPDISWWTDWTKIRKDTPDHDSVKIDLRNTSILKHKSNYVLLFDMVLENQKTDSFVGKRKLYVTREDDQYKIKGDEYQYIPKESKSDNDTNPILIAASNLKSVLDFNNEINLLIDKWLTAWSNKDIDVYGDCYAKDFRAQGKNLTNWLKYKSRLNRKYKYIHVTKDNLVIKKEHDRIIAYFTQIYQSSGYRNTGTKKLIFKREEGQWKIYREIWKKS